MQLISPFYNVETYFKAYANGKVDWMQTYKLAKICLKRNNAIKPGKGKVKIKNDCIVKINLGYLGFSH